MTDFILARGQVAVVTGGASGIGLACAKQFAAGGSYVAIADLEPARIARAVDEIVSVSPNGKAGVLGVEVDVRHRAELEHLESVVVGRFGGVDLLMNNAAIGEGGDVVGPSSYWERVLATNLWGVIHGTQVFLPGMLSRGRRGFIINTGSKQGITTPPGNPAYNVAKAGVKVFTESLQHQLRNTADCRLTAHLLIPGFVFTGMTANARGVKPDAAWSPEQTVDFMLAALQERRFYILCPDNDVDRALDVKRILWAAGDIVHDRPPLSRWHPDYKDAFEAFTRQ